MKHWSDKSECSLTVLVLPLPVHPTDHTCPRKHPSCGNLLTLAATLYHNPASGRGESQVGGVKWAGSNKRREINICFRAMPDGLHSLVKKDCLVARPPTSFNLPLTTIKHVWKQTTDHHQRKSGEGLGMRLPAITLL